MSEILDDHLMQPKPEPTGKFEFFRDFFNEEQVAAFTELLDSQGVPHKIEPVRTLMDSAITGKGLMPHAVLKLRSADFTKVNQLLAARAIADADFINSHYFQDYKAAELLEVVQKPDEWNAEDVAVAQHLLGKQGIEIPSEKLKSFEAERRRTFELGKSFNMGSGLFYLAVVVIASLFINKWFWVGGIGLGWYYWMDKSVYLDGQSYFTYDTKGRNIGKAIFVLSCLALVLSMLVPFGIHFFF